jgi:hypothetical protein
LALAARADITDDLRSLVRQSLAGLEQSSKKIADYAFLRRAERKEYSSKGELRSTKSWLTRRELQDGFMVTRLVERDGRPIPESERLQNEQTLHKRLAELKALTPEQLQKRREENRRRERDEDAWLKEFPDALDYKLVGEETLDGRPALILEATPRPGYRPKNLRARVFEKVRGRVWIDKADSQLAQAEAEVFDTVNIGWGFLGRIDKGTRFFIRRKRVADNTWLPEQETVKFDARMMLVKSMHQELTTRTWDYRHRTETAAAASAP